MECNVKIYCRGLLALVANASSAIKARPRCILFALRICSFVRRRKKKASAHTDTLKHYHLHGHSGNVISIFAPLPNSVNAHLFDVFRAAAQMPQSELCRTSSWWLVLRIKGKGRKKKKREREKKKRAPPCAPPLKLVPRSARGGRRERL